MSMKIAEALSAYANAAKGGAGMAARDGSGSGFADLVRQAAQDSVATLHKAEGATLQAAVGKVLDQGLRTGDIHTPGTQKVGTVEMGDAVVAALRP